LTILADSLPLPGTHRRRVERPVSETAPCVCFWPDWDFHPPDLCGGAASRLWLSPPDPFRPFKAGLVQWQVPERTRRSVSL